MERNDTDECLYGPKFGTLLEHKLRNLYSGVIICHFLRDDVTIEPAVDLADAKAQDFTNINSTTTLQINGLGGYIYDSTSTATPDDNNVIEPTVGGGRLLRQTQQIITVNGSGQLESSNVDFTAIDTNIGFSAQTFAGINFNPMDTATRNAIVAPSNGATIQNTDSNRPNNYDGTVWQEVAYLSDITANSSVFTTVGTTGADYTSIAAAFAAGERNLYVINDVTESANFTFSVPNDKARVILGPNVRVSYGNFSPYIITTSGVILHVSGGVHECNRAAQNLVDAPSATGSQVVFTDASIEDNLSAATSYLFQMNSATSSNLNLIIENCFLQLSNTTFSGFSGNAISIQNTRVTAGGAACANVLNGTNFSLKDVSFDGTASGVNDFFNTPAGSTFENVSLTGLGAIIVDFEDSILQKITSTSTTIDLRAGGEVSILDSDLTGATIDIQSTLSLTMRDTIVTDFNDINLSSSVAQVQKISGSTFINNANFGTGTNGVYIVSDCIFQGNCAISLTGTNASINMSNSRIGAPGGAETFSISVGTQKAVMNGNRSPLGLTDNSSNADIFADNTY